MRLKTVEAAAFDEAQACALGQAVARGKGPKTVIFVGDKTQNIVRLWPRWTRLPWVSRGSQGVTAAPAEEC